MYSSVKMNIHNKHIVKHLKKKGIAARIKSDTADVQPTKLNQCSP